MWFDLGLADAELKRLPAPPSASFINPTWEQGMIKCLEGGTHPFTQVINKTTRAPQ